MLSDIMAGIVPDDMPDHIREHESVRRLVENVDAWAEEFDRWVDPDSEYYAEELWDQRREGYERAKDDVLRVLRDAIYDADLFGKETTLGDLYDVVWGLDEKERANG